MLPIFIDFETRSRVDLKAVGAYKYASHWSTRVMCMAWRVGREGHVNIWIPGEVLPNQLQAAIKEGALIHAHNANFEKCIWNGICLEKHSFPVVPFENWRCTAAKARHCNQPGGLDAGIERLLPGHPGKDKEGTILMRRMCKPISITLKNCTCKTQCVCECPCPCEPLCTCGLTKTGRQKKCKCQDKCKHKCVNKCRCKHEWVDDAESLEKLYEYCKQDVRVETDLDDVLPDWPDSEVRVWQMTELINDEGIPLDYDLCVGAKKILDETLDHLGEKISKKTGGLITKGTQIQRIKKYIAERGIQDEDEGLDGLRLQTLLLGELPDDVREILVLRQGASGAAANKFQAALDVMEEDHRGRGLFIYCGASATGRFISVKLQAQNMKHGTDTTGMFRAGVMDGNTDFIKMMFGNDLITTLGENVRSCIRAPEGYTLVRVDSSQVECRICHWGAGNEKKLTMFREGVDPYIELAKKVYNVTIDKRDPRRQICKHAELGLQYGQGAARFKSQVYTTSKGKITLTDKFSKFIVDVYRKDNPMILKYWSNLERAAYTCVEQGRPTRVGHISFGMWGDYLTVRLPSGRRLFYYQPKFKGDGRNLRFCYTTPNGRREEWAGGLLCNNITQGTARDTLVFYMDQAMKRGITLISQIHDELIALCKIEDAEKTEADLMDCFAQRMPWMGDLPLGAEAKVFHHYSD